MFSTYILLHLIHAIPRARATSLMRVKNSTYCLGHWNEENERKNKNIK